MDRTGLEWIGVWVGIRIGVDRSGLEWSGSECGSRRERIGAGFELFRFRCGMDRSFARDRIGAGFEWLRRGVSGSELQRSWLRRGVSGSENHFHLAASRREQIGASESSACVRACACESREQCVVRLVRVRAESSAW